MGRNKKKTVSSKRSSSSNKNNKNNQKEAQRVWRKWRARWRARRGKDAQRKQKGLDFSVSFGISSSPGLAGNRSKREKGNY